MVSYILEDPKVVEYLKKNKIVTEFLGQLKELLDRTRAVDRNINLHISIGTKFIKIVLDTSVWGFISRVNGVHKQAPIKKGDLMKPATWRTVAKHARGNIIDGTARYDAYGPVYLTN